MLSQDAGVQCTADDSHLLCSNFRAGTVSAKQTIGFHNLDARIAMVQRHNGALKSMTVAEALVYTSLLRSEPGTEIPLIKVITL